MALPRSCLPTFAAVAWKQARRTRWRGALVEKEERMRKLVHAAGAVAVALALGFGGQQVLAAPAQAQMAERACTSSTCGTACFKKGYTHWACWNGVCQCSYGPPP
jgi:hypothetical protein